jgi:hypothetical protein
VVANLPLIPGGISLDTTNQLSMREVGTRNRQERNMDFKFMACFRRIGHKWIGYGFMADCFAAVQSKNRFCTEGGRLEIIDAIANPPKSVTATKKRGKGGRGGGTLQRNFTAFAFCEL